MDTWAIQAAAAHTALTSGIRMGDGPAAGSGSLGGFVLGLSLAGRAIAAANPPRPVGPPPAEAPGAGGGWHGRERAGRAWARGFAGPGSPIRANRAVQAVCGHRSAGGHRPTG